MKTKNLENTLNIVKENFLRYFTFKGTIDDWQFFAAVFLADSLSKKVQGCWPQRNADNHIYHAVFFLYGNIKSAGY